MIACKQSFGCITTLQTFLISFPANKSIVSSSMGTDCTFFQTLDDHVTQPVLFIPETHLSSLQRMVGAPLTDPDPLNPCRHESEGGEKKKAVGKVGWEGEDTVRVKRGERSDELIGVETRHMYKLLQLLTLRLSHGGSCKKTHTQTSRQTLDVENAPPSSPLLLARL